jgi:hypothetical protein
MATENDDEPIMRGIQPTSITFSTELTQDAFANLALNMREAFESLGASLVSTFAPLAQLQGAARTASEAEASRIEAMQRQLTRPPRKVTFVRPTPAPPRQLEAPGTRGIRLREEDQ